VQVWEALSPSLRRQTMNEASAPFTRHARGLVPAESAGAVLGVNFQRGIERGLWFSSRVLGVHVNAGEGGAANLASMDQGIVTAAKVVLDMARAHGATPQLIQTHGTSTELNNLAEIQSLHRAFRYAGITQPIHINALKGLVGHSMGAASAVDLVMGLHNLLEGRAPRLFNFRAEDLDPRLAERLPEAMRQFRFSSEPVTGPVESLLIASEGFLSSDAAVVLGHFPQDADAAVEMLRDYGVPEHQRAEWRVRAEEQRSMAEDWQDRVRRGRVTLREASLALGFNRKK